MKIFVFTRIKSQLISWLLLIALTPLLIASFITYEQRVKAIENRTFDKLIAIRDLKVERLLDWLKERRADMTMISNSKEIISLEAIHNKRASTLKKHELIEGLRHYLDHFLRSYEAYNEIFIIHPATGKVILSTNQNMEGEDKSDYDYFKKPMHSKAIFIQDIYYSRSLSSRTMTFSIPLFSNQNKTHITGIIVARIDLEASLYPILQDRIGLGETGETLIVNANAMVLNELRWHKNAPLNLKIKAAPAVNASQGKTGIMTALDYRGEEVLAAYTYLPNTGWGFVSKQDMYELKAPVREMIYNFIILFIISIFFIYVAAQFIANSISKPIVAINDLTKKISSGDYSVRIQTTNQDEVGSLGSSINRMVETIQSWNQSLNDKVNERTKDLEQKTAEMERFTYTVSHDLKSPLVTIKGFVGLLEKDAKNGDKKHMDIDIGHINNAALTMQLLLDELLEFSRVGRLDNPYENISMNKLINEVMDTLRVSISTKNVKIDVQPNLPNLFADRPRIKEVIQNIIENAVKFMGDQSSPCIEINGKVEYDRITYYIRDNGIGVDEQYHEKIFGMFERLNADIDGTGMGMALIKRIIETHSGSIWLESEGEGCGSTVYFSLPINGDIDAR